MSAVYIISKNGERLMPTVRYGHVRHLLKDGKAVVQGIHSPFSLYMILRSLFSRWKSMLILGMNMSACP